MRVLASGKEIMPNEVHQEKLFAIILYILVHLCYCISIYTARIYDATFYA